MIVCVSVFIANTLATVSVKEFANRLRFDGSYCREFGVSLSWEHSRRRGVVVSGVRRMNEVNARRARLVPGWVTIFGRVYHLGM